MSLLNILIDGLLILVVTIIISLFVTWGVAVFILKGMKKHYGKHINEVDDYNRHADRIIEDARRRNPYDDTLRRYCIHTYDPQTKAYYDEVCMYLDIIWPF